MSSINTIFRELLSIDSPHQVAFNTEESFSHNQFITDVKRAIANINLHSHSTYLLFAENSYHFAVNFISLLILEKNITLTANSKPDWIEQIGSSFEAIIGDESLSPLLPSNHYTSGSKKAVSDSLTIPPEFTSRLHFYTSGSTSQPKAIPKSINQIFIELENIHNTFGDNVIKCSFLASVSHHHIYGLIFRLLWPLIYRFPFYTDIVLYQEQLLELCSPDKPVCFISSPAFLSRQDFDLKTLQLTECFSSGSLLSFNAAKTAQQQLGIFPIEVFGSTETGGIGYRRQTNNNQVWTLFPGIMLQKSSGQAPLLTSPYLPQSLFLDDDIELISANQFKLLGRLDRVVKIEEKRVSLDAIESSLKSSPLIEEVKVVVLRHHRTYLGAVVVLSQQGRDTLQQHSKHYLNNQLKQELINTYEAVAIPRKWRYLDQLPYNTQGKLPLDSLTALF